MWSYADIGTNYDSNIDAFLDYWSSYGGTPTLTSSYNLTFGVYHPYTFGEVIYNTSSPSSRRTLAVQIYTNMIRYTADRSFGYPSGKGSKSGRALMSTFYFGGPISDVDTKWTTVPASADCNENSGECAEAADVTTWMLDAYGDVLMTYFDETLGGLVISWQSKDVFTDKTPLTRAHTRSILPRDMMFLVLALLFVWGFIAFVKKSLFLATFALIMIVGSFLPTMLLYQLIFQQRYVGILQLLSLFIIAGIGADDVFVLLDCYAADRDFSRPLRNDLSAAWRHAAKAMLCTSSTTCFSFLTNAMSIFPAIKTFGMWCACLIFVNYVHVNFYYMCVVSVFDRYFAKRTICMRKPEAPSSVEVMPQADSQALSELEKFRGTSSWLAYKYFPVINKVRVPIMIVWVLLFIAYIACAAQLEPDPELPAMLPNDDPYQMFKRKQAKHFASVDNPYRIKTQLVIGINADAPIDRTGTVATKIHDRGKPNFANLQGQSDADIVKLQEWLTDDTTGLCPTLRNRYGDSTLKIATLVDMNNQDPVKCPWTALKTFVMKKGEAWPRPTKSTLKASILEHMSAANEQDLSKSNFEVYWEGHVYFKAHEDALAFITIEVSLSAEANMAYADGNDLRKAWQAFVDERGAAAPAWVKDNFFFTDKASFHYFVLQETIIREGGKGIAISLTCAFAVLLVATRNWLVSVCAILCVAHIVASVMAFIFVCGWKLGLLESIILVMVIGLSVDYVVHMADAFLESRSETRLDRARFMVGKMGLSVLCGAVTSLGSSCLMSLTYIQFFFKFGCIVIWTIFYSLVMAMVFFPAMMAAFGPQGSFGNIRCRPPNICGVTST